MRLLFCIPPQWVHFEGVNARPQVNIPLGVLSMAAYLQAQGWNGTIEVYDARLSAGLHAADPTRRIFGDDEDEVRRRVREAAPDVVGISNMFSSQFGQALRMAELVKEEVPGAVVVLGGPHVSVFPEESLAHPAVDFVVVGEGEERLLALLRCLEQGMPPSIPGVVGRPEDMALLRPHPRVKVDFIATVDDLPLPAYDLVDMERYFHLQANGYSPRTREWGRRAVSIITSRGCPHRCVFCSIHATMGYRWRAHGMDYLRRHLALLRDRYRIDFIHFDDDNLTHDPERFDGLLDLLLEFEPRLAWDTPNGVRGDGWNFERVRRTKDSGCQYLAVAIESGVQRVLDQVVRKRLDLMQVDGLMADARRVGLRLMAFYVVGLPGETLAEVEATFTYALDRYRRFGVWPGVSLAVALPGTELHETATREGLRDPNLPYAANQIATTEFSPADIATRYRAFLRARLAVMVWRGIIHPEDLRDSLRLAWRYRSVAWRELRKATGWNGG